MEKKKRIFLAVLIAIVLLCSIVSIVGATIKRGIPFFELTQKSFGPSQTLEGTLNFSLAEQKADIVVSGAVAGSENEMKLLDFLNEANANFDCEPSDCSVIYEASNPEKQKTTTFEGEKYFGLQIEGLSNINIKNLSFSLDGSSQQGMTCGESPLKLDILDDGIMDWEYKESSGEWCTDSYYGSECLGYTPYNLVVEAEPYCQKIKMNKTGNLKLFANLEVVSGEDAKIEISVYDGNVKKGACSIVPWSYNYKIYDCTIDTYLYPNFYIHEEKDYFICIRQVSGQGQVTIKSEASEPKCGFRGIPPEDVFTNDYALYVQLAGFAPFTESVNFDENSFIERGQDLDDYLQEYIDNKYNGNCPESCVLPLKFISMTNQDLIIDNLFFKFDSYAGMIIDDNFYDINVEWPTINMVAQALPFSVLNISAPEHTGNYMVTAKVGTKSATKSFKVESVPIIQSLSPRIVIPGKNTEFSVLVSAPPGRQIVEYMWDFGDGSSEQTTAQPKILHSYYDIDTYTLTIKAKDNLGLIGSKSFSVTSNITKETLNKSIYELRTRLENFESHLIGFIDYWYEDMLGINVTEIALDLDDLESELETAAQSELISIKTQLDSLDVPISIDDSIILIESPYFTDLEKIRPDYIAEITEEIYDSNLKTQYQNAIALWQEENFDLKIGGSTKSLTYDDRIEDIITIINIKIDSLATTEGHVVFHLPYGINYNDIRVLSDADVSDLSDAIIFSYSDFSGYETINIALPGRHDFSDIIFYVSPSLSQLGISEDGGIIITKKPSMLVGIFLMIIILLTVLILLWFIWKDKFGKKRKKLFKNPMDVYNIISFISNNQAAGMPKKKIIERLRRAGWTKKQIGYAFKKMKKGSVISPVGRPMRPARPIRPGPRRPPAFGYRR